MSQDCCFKRLLRRHPTFSADVQLGAVKSTSFEERKTFPAENTWYKKNIRKHTKRVSKRSGVDLHKKWKSFEGELLKHQLWKSSFQRRRKTKIETLENLPVKSYCSLCFFSSRRDSRQSGCCLDRPAAATETERYSRKKRFRSSMTAERARESAEQEGV